MPPKKKKKKPVLPNKCQECGAPCRKMYCSQKCKDRGYRKTEAFLKNKCKRCGEPCSKIYCSNKCKGLDKVKEPYKAICEFCNKEFTFKIPAYQRRGQVRFCSNECKRSKYNVNDNYFKDSEDIPTIYKTLGFLFGSGVIMDIKLGIIDVIAEETKLRKFAETIKSTYRIQKTDGKDMFRSYIRSSQITDYLFDIGFTSNHETHDFPIILPEYKLDFIRGFAESNSELHQDNTVMFIKVKSYSLARGIAEFLNCELVTKQLGFIVVVRNPKSLLEVVLEPSSQV